MKKIKSLIIIIILAIGVIFALQLVSPIKFPFSKSETTSATLKTEIGDFKDILKLSVLDVDIEDAYLTKVENKEIVYKIPAHCEFKYDLEKIEVEENDSALIIQLPQCEPEITTGAKSVSVLYEEEGFLSTFMNNNITDEGDKKAIIELTDSIKRRVKEEYQQLAFEQAKNLLESFYSNSGKKHIEIKKK